MDTRWCRISIINCSRVQWPSSRTPSKEHFQRPAVLGGPLDVRSMRFLIRIDSHDLGTGPEGELPSDTPFSFFGAACLALVTLVFPYFSPAFLESLAPCSSYDSVHLRRKQSTPHLVLMADCRFVSFVWKPMLPPSKTILTTHRLKMHSFYLRLGGALHLPPMLAPDRSSSSAGFACSPDDWRRRFWRCYLQPVGV